jgi:hypothetical protein
MGDFNGANYSDSFIADLVSFVAADDFQSMFENFFIKHAMEFSYEAEHKLKYYEIYQEFHVMFEGQLETYCKSKKMAQSDFMSRCREARDEDPKAKHYIDILLSSVEYETFVKLMRIMRPVAEARIAAQAEAKSTSLDEDKEVGGKGVGPAAAQPAMTSSSSSGSASATHTHTHSSPAKAAAKDIDEDVGYHEPAMSKGGDGVIDDAADAKGTFKESAAHSK